MEVRNSHRSYTPKRPPRHRQAHGSSPTSAPSPPRTDVAEVRPRAISHRQARRRGVLVADAASRKRTTNTNHPGRPLRRRRRRAHASASTAISARSRSSRARRMASSRLCHHGRRAGQRRAFPGSRRSPTSGRTRSPAARSSGKSRRGWLRRLRRTAKDATKASTKPVHAPPPVYTDDDVDDAFRRLVAWKEKHSVRRRDTGRTRKPVRGRAHYRKQGGGTRTHRRGASATTRRRRQRHQRGGVDVLTCGVGIMPVRDGKLPCRCGAVVGRRDVQPYGQDYLRLLHRYGQVHPPHDPRATPCITGRASGYAG